MLNTELRRASVLKFGVVVLCLWNVVDCLRGEGLKKSTLQRINVNGKWLIDSDKRIRLFHGFNSVRKGPPRYDEQIFNTTRLEILRQWGFNAVRLGTMWAGVEPKEGIINSTYLAILEEIVNQLKKYGMYVIMDMHQDVLSSGFDDGSYEGIPR